MAILDSEGMQLVIEMAVASVAGIVGLWFLKRRTKIKNDNDDDKSGSSGSEGHTNADEPTT
jgi:hypothetical protein